MAGQKNNQQFDFKMESTTITTFLCTFLYIFAIDATFWSQRPSNLKEKFARGETPQKHYEFGLTWICSGSVTKGSVCVCVGGGLQIKHFTEQEAQRAT